MPCHLIPSCFAAAGRCFVAGFGIGEIFFGWRGSGHPGGTRILPPNRFHPLTILSPLHAPCACGRERLRWPLASKKEASLQYLVTGTGAMHYGLSSGRFFQNQVKTFIQICVLLFQTRQKISGSPPSGGRLGGLHYRKRHPSLDTPTCRPLQPVASPS